MSLYEIKSHKCCYVIFIVNFEQVFANWDAIRETYYFHVPFIPTEKCFRQISLEESSTVVFLIKWSSHFTQLCSKITLTKFWRIFGILFIRGIKFKVNNKYTRAKSSIPLKSLWINEFIPRRKEEVALAFWLLLLTRNILQTLFCSIGHWIWISKSRLGVFFWFTIYHFLM